VRYRLLTIEMANHK